MVQENTPPPSPSEAIMDLSDNDDDDVGEPLEVIDLDELEEEVDDDGEDELEDGVNETIQEEIEDNSILKFTEHSGKFNVKILLNIFLNIFFIRQILFFASMFNQEMTIQWWHQEDKMILATFGP